MGELFKKIGENNYEIFRLTIPNILTNITIPLLGAVDLAFVGHFSSNSTDIGALGLATVIFNVIFWAFGFLRMSTTGLTAHASGRQADTFLILYRALFLALFFGVALITFQSYISYFAFDLFLQDEALLATASSYFHIRIWAAPASLCLYVLHGWFLGIGRSVSPFLILSLVNIVNIVANFGFVYYLQWEIAGVAIGTVIAQYSGVLLGAVLLFKYEKQIFSNIGSYLSRVFNLKELAAYMKMNSDIFIRTMLMNAVFSYFAYSSESLGPEVLAANTILLNIINIHAFFSDGFAFSSERLVGKSIGSRDIRTLSSYIQLIFIWSYVFTVLFALMTYILFDPLIELYSYDREILALLARYKFFLIAYILIGNYCFIWDGIFLGATDSKSMRNSMIICAGVFFILAVIFMDHAEAERLWLLFCMFAALRGILLHIFANKRKRIWLNLTIK